MFLLWDVWYQISGTALARFAGNMILDSYPMFASHHVKRRCVQLDNFEALRER